MSRGYVFLAVLVFAIWGLQAEMPKLGLHQFQPIFMLGMRFMIMALLLLPFLGDIRGKLTPTTLAVGGTLGVAHFALLYIDFQYTDVPVSMVVYQINTIFIILLSAIVLREVVEPTVVLGITLAFADVALIAGESKSHTNLTALLIIVGSAVMFFIVNVIACMYDPMRTRVLNALVLVVAWPCLLLLSIVTEQSQVQAVFTTNGSAWSTLLYAVFIGCIAGFTIWNWLLSRCQIDRIAPFRWLVPVHAMIDVGSNWARNAVLTSSSARLSPSSA